MGRDRAVAGQPGWRVKRVPKGFRPMSGRRRGRDCQQESRRTEKHGTVREAAQRRWPWSERISIADLGRRAGRSGSDRPPRGEDGASKVNNIAMRCNRRRPLIYRCGDRRLRPLAEPQSKADSCPRRGQLETTRLHRSLHLHRHLQAAEAGAGTATAHSANRISPSPMKAVSVARDA